MKYVSFKIIQTHIITRTKPTFKYRGKVIILHDTIHPLFIDYCSYFNGNQDFFECHEVLEELWKEIAPGDKQHALVGLIQVATSMYHWRRGNFRGAEKAMKSAIDIVRATYDSLYAAYIDFQQLASDCDDTLARMKQGASFQYFKLIFSDETFKLAVETQIRTLPQLEPEFLMHKHTLRDRSEVIAARAARLAEKKRF